MALIEKNMGVDVRNPQTYIITDALTGEVIDAQIFVDSVHRDGWVKTYADMLAGYIRLSGNSPSKVLAYFIENRTRDNRVINTVRGIAEDVDVSPRVVSRVIKALGNKNFLRKVRNGVYVVSPNMIRYGDSLTGIVVMKIWEEAR